LGHNIFQNYLSDIASNNSILNGAVIEGPRKEALRFKFPLKDMEEADEFEAYLSDPIECIPSMRMRYVRIKTAWNYIPIYATV